MTASSAEKDGSATSPIGKRKITIPNMRGDDLLVDLEVTISADTMTMNCRDLRLLIKVKFFLDIFYSLYLDEQGVLNLLDCAQQIAHHIYLQSVLSGARPNLSSNHF